MTTKTAAIRYARALFDVGRQEKADLERIEQELAAFNRLFDEQPALRKVLLNPAVPVPRKRGAVIELTKHAAASPIVAKLLTLLAERDRLILLPDLLASYRDRLLDYQKIVRAEVTTAAPLAPEKTRAIEQRIAEVSGRKVRFQSKVDPQIIGGLVAKVGSTVYDASITRQLEKMRQRLIESM